MGVIPSKQNIDALKVSVFWYVMSLRVLLKIYIYIYIYSVHLLESIWF
jgi:hypothetical protein